MAAIPSLDALQAFLIFAEKLNFTHAAEVLHISQPALFVKIQDLSQALNVQLYRKIGRRLELTEPGMQVSRFARQILEQTTGFVDELQTGASRQSVVLAAGEGAYLYLLGEPLRRYLQNSNQKLRLLTLNKEGIIDALQSGIAQIGVSSLESTPPGFQSHLLCKVDQVLVMPKKHPLVMKRKLRLKDLEKEKLVVPPIDRPHRQMLAAFLQSEGVNWQVAIEASGWELMLSFVRMGLGLAVVNSSCTIPPGLLSRKIKELPQVHYHLIHLKGEAKSGAAAALKEHLLSFEYLKTSVMH